MPANCTNSLVVVHPVGVGRGHRGLGMVHKGILVANIHETYYRVKYIQIYSTTLRTKEF
jgi:hypothetical protein